MSQNIKNNLFRFVTLRSPQLIDEKDKQMGFVYHPSKSSDSFVTAVSGQPESDKKSRLEERANDFSNPFDKISDVKQENTSLYEFSSWLMRNKNALSLVEIKENSNGVALLGSQEAIFWENLIYQTVTKSSTYVREVIIRMLVANQFLEAFRELPETLTEFTSEQDKEFTRRANASVVMPTELFSNVVVEETVKQPIITELQKQSINDEADIAIAKDKIADYNALLEELKSQEEVYNKASKKAYDDKIKEYNNTVEQLIADATPTIVQEKDPDTGLLIDELNYSDLDLPKFSYPSVVTIDNAYLSDKISSKSLDVFNKEGLEMYDTFTEIKLCLNSKIKRETQLLASKLNSNTGKVKVGGAYIPTKSTSQLPSNPYCFLVRADINNLKHKNIYMYLATPQNTEVLNATYSLTLNSNNAISFNGTDVRRVHGGGISTHLGLILFESGLSLASGIYTLTGEFTLSNGETIGFTVDNFNVKNIRESFTGCATVVGGVEPTIANNLDAVYGVTNLGIADFRRVEQEVCCYVPGEVSHIENVMAREYKERSTRSLTSAETTTEDTRESEVENLTDTTTTERNEMQSEVASVLNEDQSQSYGANASVRGGGKNWGFTAGASFDSATSSSSSNSNTQAQTYAQEVTERAMERIVQKVSSKRTSLILKEFEENNSHGFDNRKGENHVTGVYRWVDKIYKNKLINYGKRLMYEFAIPEPANFFKEAIWRKIQNGDIDKDLIVPEKPIHPSQIEEMTISSPFDINQNNYQVIAGLYNAEVSEPQKKVISVSESFKVDFLENDQEGNSVSGSVSIPEGYKATGFRVAGSMFHHGDNNNAKIGISVGDQSLPLYYSSTTNDPIETEETIPLVNAIGDLAVSASTYDTLTVSFNVDVDCELTDSTLSQWQNETFNAIMEAYQDRVNEYNDAQNQQVIQEGDEVKLTFNPLQNRAIEKRELKRIAIELMAEQKGQEVSKSNYGAFNETTKVSKVDKTSALQQHLSEVKFFEQAFDWEIMAYSFYPYFYADENDWVDLFQEQDAADPIFQTFLQSGMARTVVPVRSGFEDAVNWYMTTGDIWNGQGLIVDQDDDLYVSVAEEMQTVQGEVEGTWETRLPTALTILQADGIGLEVQGLPCNPECDPEMDNPIIPSTDLIGGEEGVATSGVGSDSISEVITVQ